MIAANVSSTSELTLGRRYILTIVNLSASPVAPRSTYAGGGYFAMPAAVRAATALSVPAGEIWIHEFIAGTPGFDLNSTTGTVLWSLIPVL